MKANLPHLFNHRLQLAFDDQHRPVWAADQLTLREWGEWVRKVNRAHSLLPRMKQDRALHTRVARREEDRIVIDDLKGTGRRYGPTPLRLLLPGVNRSAPGLTDDQRWARYARQSAGGRPAQPRVDLSPRQERRLRHKRHHRLAKAGAF